MRVVRLLALVSFVPFAGCAARATSRACKDDLVAGDLVITEVFADFAAPSGGADAGNEWFEIYNASGRPLALDGLTLVSSKPDGSSAMSHRVGTGTIAPGQYFTLGNALPDQLPPYLDYGYGTDLGDLANTTGKLVLECGTDRIDAATYDSVKAGHSRELTSAQPPDALLNDDLASWCQGNDTEFTAGNFGTPGQDSDCQPSVTGTCSDQGTVRDVVLPGAGDLVISEVMPNPTKVSDTTGEWFEVTAQRAVDLNGVALDRAGDAAAPAALASASCLHVPAGGRVVFAHSADMTANGGLPAGSVLGTFTFSLVTGTTAAPGNVRILAGTTVVDSVTWPGSSIGKALQLDPGRIDALSNDDPSNFCDATTPYGLGDLGTPAGANAACPAVPAGMCNDQGTLRAIVKPVFGTLVISEVMANPKVEPDQEWFEITNTGQSSFDLNDLALDRVGDSRAPDVIHANDCKPVAPGGYALFAHSADPAVNGMLPAVDATFGLTMPNTGGDVRVLDGAYVLDAVTWMTSTDTVSAQLDPTKLTTTDNDNAASFCPALAGYGDGTNKGTPKAANACM